MVDRYEALERFARLRDNGVISEQEFAAEKAQLLAGDADDASSLPVAGSIGAVSPGKRRWWPWVIAVALALALIVGLMLFLTQNPTTPLASTEPTADVPTCESADARALVARAVAGSGGKLASLQHVTERSFDPASRTRVCAGDVTIAGADAQYRAFKLLPAHDGASYRAKLVAAAPPASTAATMTNTAAATGDNVAAESDESDSEHYQPGAPASRPIQITDDDQSYACCLTVGNVMRFFSIDGATATLRPSADVELQLDVTDPSGRWNGWNAFSLQFVNSQDGSNIVVLYKIVRAGQTLAAADNPPGPANPNTLLRQSFALHTTSSDDR